MKSGTNLPESAEIVIAGGGIVGCSLARNLAEAGAAVVLLERDILGRQASGANAGSLHAQLPTRFIEEESPERVRAVLDHMIPLNRYALSYWRTLEESLKADLGVTTQGGLMVAEGEAQLRALEHKTSLESAAGLENVMISGDQARAMAPCLGETVTAAAHCPPEGKADPLAAVNAIARAARAAGARLIENTAVEGIERTNRGFQVATGRGTIACERLVLAAGSWTPRLAAFQGVEVPGISRPQQMTVTERVPIMMHHLIQHVGRRLTLKQASNGTVIIGGGWEAQEPPATGRIQIIRHNLGANNATASAVVPAVGGLRVIRSWAGESFMTDGNPILGEVPKVPRLHTAVPANSGLSTGPACAQLVSDMLLGRPTALDPAPYSIRRFDG